MLWRYAFQRLLGAIPALLVMIFIAFYLIHGAPGGPFDTEKTIAPEVRATRSAGDLTTADEPG